MLVVAAFEARSETATAFYTDIFDSSKMNVIAAAEVAGAFLIAQANFMNRLLGTDQLTAAQWGFAFLACDRAGPMTNVGLVPVLPSRGGFPRKHAAAGTSPLISPNPPEVSDMGKKKSGS